MTGTEWNGADGRVDSRTGASGSRGSGASEDRRRDAGGTGQSAGTGGSAEDAGGGHGQGTGAARTAPGAPPTVPSISLPTGGGAIRDIGEKFTANSATGTGGLTIPVATSSGRAGFGPNADHRLRLGCRERAVRARLGAVTRRRSPARPTRGCRATGTTPIRTRSCSPARRTWCRCGRSTTGWEQVPQRRAGTAAATSSRQYRPRIEGSFARIERGATWRRGDALAVDQLGERDHRLRRHRAEPDRGPGGSAARVLSWLICESYDDAGNTSCYEYRAEDSGTSISHSRTSATAHRSRAPRTGTRSESGTATASPRRLPRQVPRNVTTWTDAQTNSGDRGCSSSSSTTATTMSAPRRPNPRGPGRADRTRSPPTVRASNCAPTGAVTAC
jgi:hypothetical protein